MDAAALAAFLHETREKRMQKESMRNILALAELEEADAILRAPDVDVLLLKTDPPLPLPPIPPAVGQHCGSAERQR